MSPQIQALPSPEIWHATGAKDLRLADEAGEGLQTEGLDNIQVDAPAGGS